jgi:hypothetical protein
MSDLLDHLIGAAVDARLRGDADLERTLTAAASEIRRLRGVLDGFATRLADIERGLADLDARLDGRSPTSAPRKTWN